MKTREQVVRIARSFVGAGPDLFCEPNMRGSAWCGQFALYVLRAAGLTDWAWEVGRGFAWRLPRTANPEPGDIAYIDQPYQHHAIVVRADTREIWTIDGNSDGGKVASKSRPRSDFSAFYSIAPLVDPEGPRAA
jgi:hypothetical protein